MLYDRVSFPEHAAMEASLVRIADYPFHMHKDVLEIIFLLEGRLELTVVNNVLEMESGDIYISSSNELHRLRAVEEQDNLVMILHLDLSVFMRDVPDINSYQFANSAIEKNRSGVRILGSYLKNQATRIFFPPQSDTLREIGGRILRILIAEFQCYYLGRYFPEFSNAFKDNEVQLNRIRRTCDYIYANLDQPLRVEDAAAREHISPDHLTHIMKIGTGVNFRTFLNMGRAERSAALLLENKKSLQAIAYECGYSKYRYFCEWFERCFRMTPQQYRQRYCDQTVAARESIYTILTPPEVSHYLEQFAAQSAEITINTEGPAGTVLTLPVWICLNGASYDHLTDFPLLCRVTAETRCGGIWVDTALLRRYKASRRALVRLLTDLVGLGLPIQLRLDGSVSGAGLRMILSLMKQLWPDAPDRVALSVAARTPEELPHARNLRKTAAAEGFSVQLTGAAPEQGRNPLFGSGYMPAFLLHQLAGEDFAGLPPMALLPENGKAREELTLLSAEELHSPVGHLMALLGQLDGQALHRSDGCLALRSADGGGIQVLLYRYDRSYDALFRDAATAWENTNLLSLVAQGCDSRSSVVLQLDRMAGEYALRRYVLAPEDMWSVYKKVPQELAERLTPEARRLVDASLAPRTSVQLLELDGTCRIEQELSPFEVQLLVFEKL